MNKTTPIKKTKNASKISIILWLIFVLPVGVYLAFKYRPHWFKKIWFVILLAVYALLWSMIFIGVMTNDGTNNTSQNPTIETKTITEKEAIAFTEERIDDPDLAKDKEEVEREGVDGEKTITYEVKTENDKEVSRDKIKEEVTKEPISKLIKVGTYTEPTAATPPQQSSNSSSSSNNKSPSSGVNSIVSGYCNDGTYVTGDPSKRGAANDCYRHGGWRDY